MASSSSSSSLQTLFIAFILITFTFTFTLSSEIELLLAFKSSIDDPTSALSSWSTNSSENYCSWTGITCSTTSSLVTSLDLKHLNISGEISDSICELTNLTVLNLADNYFSQSIPLHLSQCTNLLSLNLSRNQFWGTIPEQLLQLSQFTELDLSYNRIEGQIPLSLGSMRSLQVLNLASNLFTGTLHPSVFKNLSELVHLDLSQNTNFNSELPEEIGQLAKLRWIYMQRSGLYGSIPESFTGLHDLEVLDLSQNNLTGSVPLEFGLGMEKLVSLDLSLNRLTGSFPVDVCYSKALTELSLQNNLFGGLIPKTIDKCSSLERFQVQDNEFSGELPSGLWSLPELRLIRAENNQFSGEIPDVVNASSSLEQIQIDNNSFTGRIPVGFGLVHTMYRFSASFNGFNGSIPEDICDSPVMSIINLGHNSLSGSIPEFRNCRKLVSLYLPDNSLTGKIPASLGRLPVLTYIDLSNNKFSGEIPPELQNLKLALFNVSYNQLTGSVPSALVSGLPSSSLEGNAGLCGPGTESSCDGLTRQQTSKTNRWILAVIVICLTAGLILLAARLYKSYGLSLNGYSSFTSFFENYNSSFASDKWKLATYYPLRITEEQLLNALAEKTTISNGAFGKVHIVQLPGGEFVAVKRLQNSSNLSFKMVKAEIKILAKARHKNIAKLLGICYSEDTILLIHEYLQKGSLGDALNKQGVVLDWNSRLKIAIGTAQGLMYLHKDYVPRILHRNIKSNNILLDEDFEPKLTGFAIDRLTGETSYKSSMNSELGNCCYLPPEYGQSQKPTAHVDVYSFGVVLLELVTGRNAEQPMARECLDVVKWVRRKVNLTNGALQILDPNISSIKKQEMLAVLELALRCTSVMPEKRPPIDEVLRSLQSVESIVR